MSIRELAEVPHVDKHAREHNPKTANPQNPRLKASFSAL